MKRFLLCFLFSIFLLLKGQSQTNKGNFQAGLSTLPVIDILNLFPENKIFGGAFMGNIGCFFKNNIGLGINPYFAKVENKYTSDYNFHNERQDITLYGLNMYIHYYFISRKTYKIFASASGGFGNIGKKTTDLNVSIITLKSDKSIITFLTGFGFDYFISDNTSLELNVPLTFLKYISLDTYDDNFHTITPMIGVNYFWK